MKKQDHTAAGGTTHSKQSSRRAIPRERREQAPGETGEVIEEIIKVVRTEADRAVTVALETHIQELQEIIKANQGLIAGLGDALKESHVQISHLLEKVGKNEVRIDKLDEMVKTNEGLIAEHGKTLAEHHTQIGIVQNQATRINTYLDYTQKPPFVVPPTPPEIDLVPLPSRDANVIHINIIGRGFAASGLTNVKHVCIVVTSGDGSRQSFYTTTTLSGTLTDATFTLDIKDGVPAQTYNVAAMDATPNPQDWTGNLWSNSVTFVL